jgi:hypothetical protein
MTLIKMKRGKYDYLQQVLKIYAAYLYNTIIDYRVRDFHRRLILWKSKYGGSKKHKEESTASTFRVLQRLYAIITAD